MSFCVKKLYYISNYHGKAVYYHGKSFINWPRVANLNGVVIYCRILTLENVGTVVNYNAIFITWASGERK
jgi:hypothetical protein